jgi:hypothetical protein
VAPVYVITVLEPDERTADELHTIAEAMGAKDFGLVDESTMKLYFPNRRRWEVRAELELVLDEVVGDEWELRYRIDPASSGAAT